MQGKLLAERDYENHQLRRTSAASIKADRRS
jgi:hypothetical protein